MEKHRHIVQARRVHPIASRPHLILEHVSGPEGMGVDLRSWISSKRLTTAQSIEFALHIALGMQHATKNVNGLVHRDLKPANILVTHENIAKVTDFGLVRSIESDEIDPKAPQTDRHIHPSDRLTHAEVGGGGGTYQYMSPEQFQSRAVDLRSDIYSFGMLFYEMLTGKLAFPSRKSKTGIRLISINNPSLKPNFSTAYRRTCNHWCWRAWRKTPTIAPPRGRRLSAR